MADDSHVVFALGTDYRTNPNLAVRVVTVNDEFWVGATAELVQVHADALAVSVYAEGYPAIENPEKQIDERQDEAEERGHAHKLGNELTWLSSEDARGNETPEAADGVDRKGAGGIVDGDGQLKNFNK
jgi:hypothetical protein